MIEEESLIESMLSTLTLNFVGIMFLCFSKLCNEEVVSLCIVTDLC